jgi:predicted kinase
VPGAAAIRPVLHILCGKAGSGKSTLAATLAAEHAAIVISEDVWLARLYPGELASFDDYRRLSARLKTVVGPLVVDLLRAGHAVVLDYPANTRASRAWFRGLLQQSGAAHVLHFLDTHDDVCLARIARRNAERPEGSHHLAREDFEYLGTLFEPPGDDEGFDVQRVAVH